MRCHADHFWKIWKRVKEVFRWKICVSPVKGRRTRRKISVCIFVRMRTKMQSLSLNTLLGVKTQKAGIIIVIVHFLLITLNRTEAKIIDQNIHIVGFYNPILKLQKIIPQSIKLCNEYLNLKRKSVLLTQKRFFGIYLDFIVILHYTIFNFYIYLLFMYYCVKPILLWLEFYVNY